MVAVREHPGRVGQHADLASGQAFPALGGELLGSGEHPARVLRLGRLRGLRGCGGRRAGKGGDGQRARTRAEEAPPVERHQVSPWPNGYRTVCMSAPAGMSTGSFPTGFVSPRITLASASNVGPM